MNQTNSISLYTCSSNQAYKSNTNKNDAILITGNSNQQIHISPKFTNSNNESLVVLKNDYMTINGTCDIKGTLLIDNIDLLEYVESNLNKQESIMYIDNSVRIVSDTNEFPGYSWSNDSNTGMYQSNIDNIDFAINANRKLNINNNGISIYGNCEVYGDIIKKYDNFTSQLFTKSFYIGNDIEEGNLSEDIYIRRLHVGVVDFDTKDYENDTLLIESLYVDPKTKDTTFNTSYIYAKQIKGVLSIEHGGTGVSTKTGNGVPVHNINPIFNSNIFIRNSIYIENDNLSNPGYSWSGDINTGIYQSSAGNIDFSVENENKININNNGVKIYGDCEIYGNIIERNVNQYDKNSYETLIVSGIFLNIDNELSTTKNIITRSFFIGDQGSLIPDNSISTINLYINPDEIATFEDNYVNAYEITKGILSIEHGGTGVSTKTGYGIPVFDRNPIFTSNITVNENVIANEYMVKVPNTINGSTQINNALDILDKLNPVLYSENNSLNSLIHGDIINLIPELSHIISNNNGNMLYNYLKLIPYLIKSIKELKSRLDSL